MAMVNDKGRHQPIRGHFFAWLRYRLDNALLAGPLTLIGWLTLLALIVVIIGGAAIALIATASGEGAWEALRRVLDATTIDADWGIRIVLLATALAGIVILATLVAIISNAIASRLRYLRSGRSTIVERGHTIILNWSPAIVDAIAELARANHGRKSPPIVVLANRDRMEMDNAIARHRIGRTRIICRSGDPTALGDLALTSPATARAIVIMSPDGNEPDRRVVKSILALVRDPRRRAEPYRIAAQIRDDRNSALARRAGGGEVQLVRADAMLATILAHSLHQPELGAAYTTLLDANLCQLRTLEQKPLEGTSFGDALMAHEHAVLIGLCDADGRVYLNPPMETQIQPGLKAVIITDAVDGIEVTANPLNVDHAAIILPHRQERAPRRVLMLGWNNRGPMVAFELSRRVAAGSLLTIAADAPDLQQQVSALMILGNNLQVEFGLLDTAHQAALEGLDIPSYDSVLVLGYADHLDAQTTDTQTLVTLLHLERIAERSGRPINVVTEMFDPANSRLAGRAHADNLVTSNQLVSLLMARTSQGVGLWAILDDLLDEQGSDICLRPAEDYVELDRPMTFYTVTEACRRRGEVAIGYIRQPTGGDGEADARHPAGIVINPKKSETLSYAAGDRLIVLARD